MILFKIIFEKTYQMMMNGGATDSYGKGSDDNNGDVMLCLW